jgi:hypothetical protein
MRPRRWIGLLATGALVASGAITVLPGLYSSGNCDSEIELRNLSERVITLEVLGHRSDGSLCPLKNRRGSRLKLLPGERQSVRLDAGVSEEAWAQIEHGGSLGISASTSCRDGEELRTESRPVAYPLPDAGFRMAYESVPRDGSELLVLNTSPDAVRWTACYSGGHLVSNDSGEMVPLCTDNQDAVLLPYHSTRVALVREGRVLIRLQTTGEAVVLQLLKPTNLRLNLFRVDSTIRFDWPGR